MLLDSRTALTAVWALRKPLDVQQDEAPALELLLRVAVAVGGEAPAEGARLADLVVSVPGSAVREPPYLDYVTTVAMAAERVYVVEQIDAALAGAGKE